MKYRVKLKSTVTAWVEVEVRPEPDMPEIDLREWAAGDAVDDPHRMADALRNLPDGFEYGPIELAHEELDESVVPA